MNKSKGTYYDILNVHPRASDDDIKRAYLRLVKKFHPDLNPNDRRMAELRLRVINEAYTGIKSRERRAKYNQTMRIKAENDNTKNGTFFSQIAEIFWPKETQRTK